jgi:hypothetical protein
MLKTGCTTQESDLICLSQLWRYLSYFNGAVGMTLEQGGIGQEEIVMSNGINLTIRSTNTCNGSINGRKNRQPSRCFAERIQRFYE